MGAARGLPRDGGERPCAVDVNIAPEQVGQADFVELAHDSPLSSGLPPERLEIDVAKASLLADRFRRRCMMRGLDPIGVRVAVGDCCKGGASFAALRSFPFGLI